MIRHIVVEDSTRSKLLCDVHWSGGPLILEVIQEVDQSFETHLKLYCPFQVSTSSIGTSCLSVTFDTILHCNGLISKLLETEDYEMGSQKTMNLITLLE